MSRSSLDADRRRRTISEFLQRDGQVNSAELAQRFGVTIMTIRRDLKELESDGLAMRCYGGAAAAQRITLEFDFHQRHRQHLEEKARIGQAAADLVRPGNKVLLDTGTTTLEVAKSLARRIVQCHVMTSSLVIASQLWGRSDIQLSLLGGDVRWGSPDLAGPLTEWMLERLSADVAFLGTEGIDPQRGSFAGDTETARIAERMAANSGQTVIVADSSKLGKSGLARYAEISQMDILITDKSGDPGIIKELTAKGVNVKQV